MLKWSISYIIKIKPSKKIRKHLLYYLLLNVYIFGEIKFIYQIIRFIRLNTPSFIKYNFLNISSTHCSLMKATLIFSLFDWHKTVHRIQTKLITWLFWLLLLLADWYICIYFINPMIDIICKIIHVSLQFSNTLSHICFNNTYFAI